MNSKGLGIFLQDGPATDEQLFQLLEWRKEAILPKLDEVRHYKAKIVITTDTLVEWIGTFFHFHGEVEGLFQGSNTAPTPIEDGGFDVGPPGDTHRELWPGYEKHFWGIVNGQWVHIAVGWYTPPKGNPFPRYARMSGVETAKELCEVAHVPPRDVLGYLYRWTQDWVMDKRDTLERFQRLEAMMEAENAVLALKTG
ncbi:hypothetical protein IT407_04155 [Candidatus Uhrbacteria bacterium]|nr:hypothetical protein [Candidatus Uhrbacteria bacterium]